MQLDLATGGAGGWDSKQEGMGGEGGGRACPGELPMSGYKVGRDGKAEPEAPQGQSCFPGGSHSAPK